MHPRRTSNPVPQGMPCGSLRRGIDDHYASSVAVCDDYQSCGLIVTDRPTSAMSLENAELLSPRKATTP
jgi:hypothetical protein